MKRQLDERIADWVDGRLSPRELARLKAEFEVNSKLYRAAEDYRESVEQVRRALAEPEKPVDLTDRVWKEIQVHSARRRLGRVLPFLASFAAAAAIILLFFALDRVQPAANRGDFLEVASREAGEAEDRKAEGWGAADSETEEESETKRIETESDAETRVAYEFLTRGRSARVSSLMWRVLNTWELCFRPLPIESDMVFPVVSPVCREPEATEAGRPGCGCRCTTAAFFTVHIA